MSQDSEIEAFDYRRTVIQAKFDTLLSRLTPVQLGPATSQELRQVVEDLKVTCETALKFAHAETRTHCDAVPGAAACGSQAGEPAEAYYGDDWQEVARLKAETVRVRAERARLHAETARINAETERLKMEAEKVRAEAERAKVETQRLAMEVEKVKAETEYQRVCRS